MGGIFGAGASAPPFCWGGVTGASERLPGLGVRGFVLDEVFPFTLTLGLAPPTLTLPPGGIVILIVCGEGWAGEPGVYPVGGGVFTLLGMLPGEAVKGEDGAPEGDGEEEVVGGGGTAEVGMLGVGIALPLLG